MVSPVQVSNLVLVASAQDRLHSACQTTLDDTCRLLKCRNGVECIECLQKEPVDVVVLDAALQWGGADGVLEFIENSAAIGPARRPLVFLVATEVAADLLYRISQHRVDDFQIGLHDRANLGMRIRNLLRSRNLSESAEA